MSFHLTFVPASGLLDAAGFETLFADRLHTEVGGAQAAYQNADTGVYFLFDHEGSQVRFSVNTRRSEIFAREAAEVLGVVFGGDGFVLADSREKFSAEAFLAAWREANQAAIAAMLADETPPSLPLQTNLAVWRWNRRLPRQQYELEHEAVAPPLIFLAGPDGNPRPTYVWMVTVPMVKPPPADWVLLADEAAPRFRDKLLGHAPQPDTIGVMDVKWLHALRLPSWRPERAPDLMLYHARPGKRSPMVLAALAAAEGYARPAGAPIPIDQVLDRETVEAARVSLEA